jgi:penicillin-binding protein 1A
MTRAWISRAWFGRDASGLEAAAVAYFGKKADALRLHELALLVGLTQAPGRYDPDCSPEPARARRQYVLDRLLDAQLVSLAEHDDAVAQPLGVVPRECRRE